ncbi:CCA tRNA nucleotidyltransferase [Chloroflexota bacterium]
MSEEGRLDNKIKGTFPDEMARFLRNAGKQAQKRGKRLYLVGGVVRDLLLGRRNEDIDLVLEGDAIGLARRLLGRRNGKVTEHHRFSTAKVQWAGWSVDVATARRETYSRPGALPKVKPGTMDDDLLRRDFTVNAMAVDLSSENYGALLDPYGGMDDLQRKQLRVLHERSFIDDATRIWRGMRYEQRLGFQFEAKTLNLLKRDINMLETISGDRIRHELELVLKEKCPGKVFHRADELGVLGKIHPGLKASDWLTGKFDQARKISAPESVSSGLYLALLAYHLDSKEVKKLIVCLKFSKMLAQVLQDTISLKGRLKALEEPELKPSRIYALLCGYQLTAVTANQVAADSTLVAGHIMRYLKKLRHVKPSLTGKDLELLGMPPGPQMKEILTKLRDARLNGKVKNRRGEEEMVRGLLHTVKRS